MVYLMAECNISRAVSILNLLIQSKSNALFYPEILAYLVVYENFTHGGIYSFLNQEILYKGTYDEFYLVQRLAVTVTKTKEYEEYLEKIKIEYNNEKSPKGSKEPVELFTLDEL